MLSTSDNEYYLASQILPSIGRLCEPIDGTDRPRLAECLGTFPARKEPASPTLTKPDYVGLNPDQYAGVVVSEPRERRLGVLDTQTPDSERFRDTDPLTIRCPSCAAVSEFGRIHEEVCMLKILSLSP